MEHREIEGLSFRRPAQALEAEVCRELTAEDIILRASLGCNNPGTPNLKKLKSTHHKLAQLLAMGTHEAEASLHTGYGLATISILKNDPAFKELLHYYGNEREKVYVDVQQRMAGFSIDCLDVLQDRLETKPDAFSVKDLNNLIKTTADRGGHSPVHKTENKTLVLTAEDLTKLKQEVESTQNGQIRKINQAEETQRVRAFLSDSSGAQHSAGDNGPAELVPEEAATSRGSSGGDNI